MNILNYITHSKINKRIKHLQQIAILMQNSYVKVKWVLMCLSNDLTIFYRLYNFKFSYFYIRQFSPILTFNIKGNAKNSLLFKRRFLTCFQPTTPKYDFFQFITVLGDVLRSLLNRTEEIKSFLTKMYTIVFSFRF